LAPTSSTEPPRTAAPAPGDFAAVYEELTGRYERVLSLQLAATLSGTFASASTGAEQFDSVRVIDTGTVSAAITMLALGVQRRLDRGTSDEEVDGLVERYRREHRLLFTLDTLEYLARGGRIGRAAAFAGSLLSVKPILSIRDGEVVPLKRVRGTQKALDEFRAVLVAESADVPSLRVGVAHAAAPERLAALESVIREARPQATLEVATSLGAVVGTHAGPGTVGLFWFDDPET
jgi:DegV family protein with EDD domain